MFTIIFLWTLFWLIRISVEDIRSYTIPNRWIVMLLLAAPFLSDAPLASRVLAAVLPAALIPLMGMGDVKLYAVLGAGCGLSGLLRICCGSMLAGGAYALLLVLFKRAKKKDRIAFGPFIAASAAVYLFLSYFASTSAMCAISLSMLAV